MTLAERISALSTLPVLLAGRGEQWAGAREYAAHKNRWFTEDNTQHALDSIIDKWLDPAVLSAFMAAYPGAGDPARPQRVGIVLAGNIPMVGFHDVLCVILSGHIAHIKLSSRDEVLLPYLLRVWTEAYPALQQYYKISERINDLDAYIATGGDNSARYFEYYFGRYPHIIRRNRTSVAVIRGDEEDDVLLQLGADIFSYFGLGCRNVSKIYLPQGYDPVRLLELWHEPYKHMALHTSYKNNFDYNYALFVMNKIPFLLNGATLLKEDTALHSRIACVHYEYYTDINAVASSLASSADQIQCIVTQGEWPSPHVGPGESQRPGIGDFADGVDTMDFLMRL